MRLKHLLLGALAAVGCAKGSTAAPDGGGGPDIDGGGTSPDASCGEFCDQDNDGVLDPNDDCPDTGPGEVVNEVGCSDAQVSPTLEPEWPPFGLTWTPTGDLGRAGGLTWGYSGIQRDDLFHIYWIVCDDPATPCGLSLDGPVDVAAENWVYSAADSDLLNGLLVFTNTTHILLADSSTPTLNGRLTMTIQTTSFASVADLGVPARDGDYGAEIPGTTFQVGAIAEVQPVGGGSWTPYLDYYDAQQTAQGGSAATSFGGSFYSE